MNKFIALILLTASLVVSGCSVFGDTRLRQVQTIAEITFLATNVDEMTENLLKIDFTPSERAKVDEGLALYGVIKNQIARLAKGDIDSELLMDFPTARQIHTDIAKAYNMIVVEALRSHQNRTGLHPGEAFIQFDQIGRSVWQRMDIMLNADEAVSLDDFIGQLRIFASTFAIIEMSVKRTGI